MQEKFGNSQHSDVIYLRKALELAKIRRGFCAPNPSVGAVVVRDGLVIAAGHHAGPGLDHAEADALKKLSFAQARGATVYVTLEPCCHYGRTPPCTDMLIKAGVKRVVYGFGDPNPIVAGKGQSALEAAGIVCEHLFLAEINTFYESYRYWHSTNKPFVTAKIALSLDGKIAGATGEPIKITGEALQEFTHYSRKKNDAILTTSKTILKDDPQLNVRSQGQTISKILYVLDTHLNVPVDAKVFKTASSIIFFHASTAAPERISALQANGARCISVDTEAGKLNLNQVIDAIGRDGIHDLWIEAGGECFAAFAQQQLLHKAFIYVGSRWVGDGKAAFDNKFVLDLFNTSQVRWLQFGRDVLCEIQLAGALP
jgi:diaminohydroxyphosphoribosylaminopyrimidine deaminase/5-amino-6-(5-phosphoribosylamino)uracil reductase